MKRFFLCVFILIVIISSAFITLFSLKNHSNQMAEKITELQLLAEKEKTDDVLQSIEEIKRLWSQYYDRMSFIIQYDKTSDISSSINCLDVSYTSSPESFIAECEMIKNSIKLLYEEQVPTLNNII